MVLQISQRYRHSILSRAFQSLAEYIAYKNMKISSSQKALRSAAGRILSKALAAWRQDFHEGRLKQVIFIRKQEAVREAVRLGEQIAIVRQQELGRSCLRMWQHTTSLSRAAAALEHRVHHRILGNALLKWIDHMDDKRLEVCIYEPTSLLLMKNEQLSLHVANILKCSLFHDHT